MIHWLHFNREIFVLETNCASNSLKRRLTKRKNSFKISHEGCFNCIGLKTLLLCLVQCNLVRINKTLLEDWNWVCDCAFHLRTKKQIFFFKCGIVYVFKKTLSRLKLLICPVIFKTFEYFIKGTAKTVFVYRCTARCLGSQNAAALPCLTQRVKHFVMLQVFYSKLILKENCKTKSFPVFQGGMVIL